MCSNNPNPNIYGKTMLETALVNDVRIDVGPMVSIVKILNTVPRKASFISHKNLVME
jgi:hypothetical protein